MRRHATGILCFTIGLLVFPPGGASAQGPSFLSTVFSKVHDVNAGFIFLGSVLGDDPVVGETDGRGLRGLALEVLLDLGMLLPWGPECTAVPQRVTEIRRSFPRSGGGDSVVVSTPPKPEPSHVTNSGVECTPRGLSGELGLGYAQVGRFRGQTVTASGALEELPVVSLYASLAENVPLVPYGGLRAGLVSLKDFRTTVEGKGAKGTASTFEYGWMVGLGYTLKERTTFFAEFAWTYRTFDGVDWGTTTLTIPEPLLQPLQLDTRTLTVGLQVKFAKD